MLLSWDKGYADYTDEANWLPRLEELRRFAAAMNVQTAQQLSDSELLDALEQLEELMRYCCAVNDMQNLEPVMRKFNDLMGICRSRGITGVEVLYLEMLFLRINAMLYRAHGQQRQGAECYDKCLITARNCFDMLKKTTHLTGKQTFFVGWSCVECWKESAEAHDSVLDTNTTVQLLHEVVPMLEWLDKFMVDHPGICDQASELYVNAAGMFYQYGDATGGDTCYRHAVRLLNTLDAVHGSDFYRARAIWIQGIHGTMAYLALGDAKVMLQCEQEAAEYLIQRCNASQRDRAIVEGAKATVTLQRSAAFQQNGKLGEAIRLAKDGVANLEASLDVIREDYEHRQGYYRTVMSNIAGRVYNIYVGSMETLGVMYYQNEDGAAAEAIFQKVLQELTQTTGLRMTGSGSVLIQAEVLQYLGLISSDAGNVYQADFYGAQSADMALSLGKESGNLNAWAIAVGSCSLVAEVALNTKNKPKASTYAELGLSACDALARINPNHPHLALRGNLEKFKKKASRRFF